VVSELSPAPSLLVCTMNTGWKRLQHEKRAKVAQRMLFAEHSGPRSSCLAAQAADRQLFYELHCAIAKPSTPSDAEARKPDDPVSPLSPSTLEIQTLQELLVSIAFGAGQDLGERPQV